MKIIEKIKSSLLKIDAKLRKRVRIIIWKQGRKSGKDMKLCKNGVQIIATHTERQTAEKGINMCAAPLQSTLQSQTSG